MIYLRVPLTVLLLAGLLPTSAAAVDVDDVRWGFDGTVVPERFNLLSVLISNPTPNTFDDTVYLTRLAGNGQRIGATLETQVFVSPFASKWVQLEPFVFNEFDRWTLSWKEASDEPVSLPQPRSSPPVSVFLDDIGDLTRRATPLKLFPEELFPPSVTATDGLRSVVLDHVPRLEASRRTAFLDWLSRGGHVHLLYGQKSRFPRFPETLGALNSEQSVTRVGRGTVYRHPRTRDAADARFLSQMAALDRHGAPERRDSDSFPLLFDGRDAFPPAFFVASDYELFHNLRAMAQTGRSWFLVYVMSIVYLLLLFPGCYLVGRSKLDYRVSYLALIVISLLFSAGFVVIGRRSVDELSQVHSIAVARPLAAPAPGFASGEPTGRSTKKRRRTPPARQTASQAEGNWDVWQWSNASVVTGGWYELTHNGSGRLYSACEPFETVNGTIYSGPQARMRVDIPPNSSRTFAHRSKLEMRHFGLSLVDFAAVGSQLQSLSLAVDGEFPTEPEELVALYRDRVYQLTLGDGQLELTGRGISTGQFLMADRLNQVRVSMSPFTKRTITVQMRFEHLFRPLLIRSLAVDYGALDERLPDDRLFVFVYAPMPQEFFLQGSEFERQTGYVLYVHDIVVPTDL